MIFFEIWCGNNFQGVVRFFGNWVEGLGGGGVIENFHGIGVEGWGLGSDFGIISQSLTDNYLVI